MFLFLVGIGSWMFHMTLRYSMQERDISMKEKLVLVLFWLLLLPGFGPGSLKLMHWKLLILMGSLIKPFLEFIIYYLAACIAHNPNIQWCEIEFETLSRNYVYKRFQKFILISPFIVAWRVAHDIRHLCLHLHSSTEQRRLKLSYWTSRINSLILNALFKRWNSASFTTNKLL